MDKGIKLETTEAFIGWLTHPHNLNDRFGFDVWGYDGSKREGGRDERMFMLVRAGGGYRSERILLGTALGEKLQAEWKRNGRFGRFVGQKGGKTLLKIVGGSVKEAEAMIAREAQARRTDGYRKWCASQLETLRSYGYADPTKTDILASETQALIDVLTRIANSED